MRRWGPTYVLTEAVFLVLVSGQVWEDCRIFASLYSACPVGGERLLLRPLWLGIASIIHRTGSGEVFIVFGQLQKYFLSLGKIK